MKYVLLLLLAVYSATAFAQTMTLKKNVLYASGKPYAKVSSTNQRMPAHYISSMSGKQIVKMYNSRSQVTSSVSYVVKFLNDNRKALIAVPGDNGVAKFVASKLYSLNVINGSEVDTAAETKFLRQYPIPKGNVDTEEYMDKTGDDIE